MNLIKDVAQFEYFTQENNIHAVREITDFPGYFITDCGKVISTRKNKVSFLKAHKNNRGYFMVGLWSRENKKSKKITVHKLVATHFLESSFFERAVVNHKDQNQENNNVDNLEWVTQKKNLNLAHSNMTVKNKHGRFWGGVSKGSSNGMSKLNEKQVVRIKEMYETEQYTLGNNAKSQRL